MDASKMQSENITVKFDGQSHQVDVDTFTQVLLNYSTVVHAAASEVGTTGDVRVSIKAIESGSLDVLVSVASQGLGGLLDFITDNKDTIAAVTALATGVFSFKQALAGKGKIKEVHQDGGGNVVATTEKGDVVVDNRVFNVYMNHPEATTAIDKTFSKLEEHPEIEALEFSKGDEVTFRAEHGEFSDIAASANYENDNVRHEEVDAKLNVMKPFLGTSKTRKWEFYYQGIKISASIEDDEFMDNMHKHSFSVGTTMHVVLDIEKTWLEQANTWVNKSYRVVEVLSVDAPPEEPITDSLL